MWVDAHCHLQLDDRGDEDGLVRRARAAGVAAMVCVGTDLATSRRAIEFAQRHSDVFAVAGLHPHEASRLDDEWDAIAACFDDAHVVGIGEAGFDLYYEHSPVRDQRRAFEAQIAAARQHGAALVIHSREAWDETFEVLGARGAPDRTVFHCFTGGVDEARRALDLGAYLSFSGIVSFASADELRAAAAFTPEDRMLVETDSPYLAPVPHRGRTNEPAYVVEVGAALAAACNVAPEDLAATTSANAARVFGLTLLT